ncbi:MAG TPA: AbrB/MazE/SpoVT family DNA-binding domain-containing protein [Gaiellaceae bacterium]|nr:AbrB/MazE/SpoVT family DNA-binding domain-containing protein [Gaiellaceae bacterium]
MAPKMHRVRIGRQGRLVVPAELRRELGVEPNDVLVAWIDDGRLVLQRREDIEREIWAMVEGIEGSMVDELIAERRREAKREAEREARYLRPD